MCIFTIWVKIIGIALCDFLTLLNELVHQLRNLFLADTVLLDKLKISQKQGTYNMVQLFAFSSEILPSATRSLHM